MNIVIIGQKWLAAELLWAVLNKGYHVSCVVAPHKNDRLAIAAAKNNIRVLNYTKSISADLIPQDTDIILTAHLHVIITYAAIKSALLGALGYHPSLLPRHRGQDAIRWAIHMREAITGGTLYWLDDGLDSGDIASQAFCHIYPMDSPKTLWKRELAPLGIRLFINELKKIKNGEIRRIKQDERLATFEPRFITGSK